ncbi:hypothetical protein HRG_007607 [Hirsutella rhossiliensis]|uniref:Uncharacterized protein n=1 Tax=Hirsutella rhossiliensis TaxID=111463 RepID=A0A9P8MW88_9HYPO|nr:uncharacterized protein HRG_07607 [Hirsutella rhossiliensis]KAH0961529.1 hypothetical protein HRG_07607 [Hirsutella rhossiliensis]
MSLNITAASMEGVNHGPYLPTPPPTPAVPPSSPASPTSDGPSGLPTPPDSRPNSPESGINGPTAAAAATQATVSVAASQAMRTPRRPTGGSVYTPVRNFSGAGQFKRCLRCLRNVPLKCMADHMKVHNMEGSGSVLVPEARRCANCVSKHRECRVKFNPSEKGCNTIRCRCCLKYKEKCDFRSRYHVRQVNKLTIHPAL